MTRSLQSRLFQNPGESPERYKRVWTEFLGSNIGYTGYNLRGKRNCSFIVFSLLYTCIYMYKAISYYFSSDSKVRQNSLGHCTLYTVQCTPNTEISTSYTEHSYLGRSKKYLCTNLGTTKRQ